MHVLVSGAGIAGLTLGYCLQRAGIECTLVEKTASPRSEGYMMDFFGSGYDAAERMDLLTELERIHHPISRLTFLNEQGREKFSVSYAAFRALFDGRHFNCMRGDLERVLYAKTQGRLQIRFGAAVESFDQDAAGVRVFLSDGATVRADLLVGADGVHSLVRHLALGREQSFSRYLGCHAAAFLIRDPPPCIHVADVFYSLTVPGRRVSVYPARGGGVATFFVHNAPDPTGETPATEELSRVYGGMGWIVPRLLERMETAEIYFDSVSQIEIPRWSAGRVVLVGDAAWCVSLLAGQGASLAMAGAYILAEELSAPGVSHVDALERYEQRLRPGIEKIQKAGRRMANWFVPENRIYLTIRDTITRLAGAPGASRLIKRLVAPESVFRLPRS